MKIPAKKIFCALIVCLLTLPLAAQEDNEAKLQAELEKARKLFPEFQKKLDSDPEAAEEIFSEFLGMQDPMKKRLQSWLDAKWAEERRAYEQMLRAAGGGDAEQLSPEQRTRIAANRKILADIRQIGSENEMKQRLKSEGWQALQTLLSIISRVDSSQGSKGVSPKNAEKALKDLMIVGDFRYQIRVRRGQPARPPYDELGVRDPDFADETESILPAADLIRADGAARKVFAKNEAMRDRIPRAEYLGILELNQWRVALGLNALEIDPKLCDASRDHSNDMKTHNFFAHQSPIKGKKEPWDRAKNFGTQARSENIAINGSPAAANQAWFYSPGHHKNMFASGRTHIGLGIVGRHYTQMFR